jgi:hypothetical protein
MGQLLTPVMSKSYSPIQEFEAKQLSVDLLDRPEDFYMHNRRYSASVIMQVVYGHRIPICKSPRHHHFALLEIVVDCRGL